MYFCKYVNTKGVLLHFGTLQSYRSNNHDRVVSLSLSYVGIGSLFLVNHWLIGEISNQTISSLSKSIKPLLMQLQTEVDNGNTTPVFQTKFCTPPKGPADFIHVITPWWYAHQRQCMNAAIC